MRNAYYTISAEKNGEKFGNSTMDYDVAKSLMGTYLDLGYTVTLRYYVRAPRN